MTATSTRQPVGRRGRGQRPPCVVFVDDSRWAAFHQLAPLLRRAGLRTLRVSVGARGGSRIASRLVYDRCEVLVDPADVGGLRAILAGEDVIDIQYVEALGELVGSCLDGVDPRVAAHIRQRLAIQDKLTAATLFAEAGVRTPAVMPLGEASPAEVAAQFGLPIVVKDRVGSAGANVVIAHDLNALVRAVADGAVPVSDRYYEQYIAGEKLNYAAAVSDAGLEQELAYRVIQWLMPAGTAAEVQTIDDPQLEAFGRQAVEVAGCTGLVNIDVIRDREGRDWLIDFNARAFGGAICFRMAGVDVSQGYLRALGERSGAVTRFGPVAGVRFAVFPTCLGAEIASGRRGRTARAFWREARPYRRWLGLRYWLSEALAIADAVRCARRSGAPGMAPAAPGAQPVVAGAGVAGPDHAA